MTHNQLIAATEANRRRISELGDLVGEMYATLATFIARQNHLIALAEELVEEARKRNQVQDDDSEPWLRSLRPNDDD